MRDWHITQGMKGYKVVIDGAEDDFIVFKADEPVKLLEEVGEKILGYKIKVTQK